jgi:hypothetical protein
MITVAKLKRRDKRSMEIVAAMFEHYAHFQNMEISLRTPEKSPLPKLLKLAFGGACFADSKRKVFRARGKTAAALLSVLLPFLTFRRREARKLLGSYLRKGNRKPRISTKNAPNRL